MDSLGGQAIVISRCDFHARQSSVMLLVLLVIMIFLETGSFVSPWLGSCLYLYPEALVLVICIRLRLLSPVYEEEYFEGPGPLLSG
jgi:hypothetical protein